MATSIEAEHRHFVVVAKQLRVVLEKQRCMQIGSAESLLKLAKKVGD